jgi:predicted nucleic acid-binding protein
VTLVLDASVTLSWLLRDASGKDEPYAFGVLHSLRSGDAECFVPVTWGLEVANVIARGEAKGQVTEAQSESFLAMLRDLAVRVDAISAGQALSDTLQLARRHKLSAYDASYLELALRSSQPLATLDADLRRAADTAGVKRFKPS